MARGIIAAGNFVEFIEAQDFGNSLEYSKVLYLSDTEIKQVQKLQNENSIIAGVAQSSGADGKLVKITVPDYIEREEG